MLYSQLEDQQVAPPTIFISGAKNPLTKTFLLLAPACIVKKVKVGFQLKIPFLQIAFRGKYYFEAFSVMIICET